MYREIGCQYGGCACGGPGLPPCARFHEWFYEPRPPPIIPERMREAPGEYCIENMC